MTLILHNDSEGLQEFEDLSPKLRSVTLTNWCRKLHFWDTDRVSEQSRFAWSYAHYLLQSSRFGTKVEAVQGPRTSDGIDGTVLSRSMLILGAGQMVVAPLDPKSV